MLKHFFSYDFLFYINRARLEQTDQVFAVIAVSLLVIAVVLKVLTRVRKDPISKKLLRRFTAIFATIGVLELAWYGTRYQNITFFGTHFAFLLVLIAGIAWTMPGLWYWLRKYRVEKAVYDKEQIKLKYLAK